MRDYRRCNLTQFDVKENAAESEKWYRVSFKNMNIRKGSGTYYDKTGRYTGIGIFTIVAESEGEGAMKWGKLKSGAGWISLDHAEKI